MASWQPDPSFYPSPRMAMRAPAETLAYVAVFDPERKKPDRLAVVDVDPESPSYAKIVGRVDMPNVGDELHHFGWNACSSCLCPNAPHPHMERRYLVVPGLRSSRIHVLDTKPDPRKPTLVKVDRGGGDRREDRLQPAAHRALRARRHLRQRARHADGKGPGGIFLLDHETLRRPRPLGDRPRAAAARLRLLVAPRLTTRWSRASGARRTWSRTGSIPELLLGGKYGHQLHVWDLRKRKHLQEIDLGAEHQMVLELRPAHDPTKAYGFVGVVRQPEGSLGLDLALVPRRRPAGRCKKVIEIPAEPADPDAAAAAAQGLQGGAAARHRHQPVARRPVPLRLVLGHRRAAAVRRVRPVQPEAHRLGAASAASSRARAHPKAPGAAQRRAADGRGQPRRQARLLHQLALRRGRCAVLSRRHPRLDGEARRRPGRRDRRSIRDFFVDWPTGQRPHQVRLRGRRRSSDSYCYP